MTERQPIARGRGEGQRPRIEYSLRLLSKYAPGPTDKGGVMNVQRCHSDGY